MKLTSEEQQTLIHIALSGGKTRANSNHGKYNVLDQKGLTEVVSKGEAFSIHELTPVGIQAILNMPDDLQVDFFPLPTDIAKAKRIVESLK